MTPRLALIIGGLGFWIGLFTVSLITTGGLKYDNDKWLAEDNPNEIARNLLKNEFNQFESTMLVFDARALFEQEGFHNAIAFTDAVKQIEGVVDVISVYDASLIMNDPSGSLVVTTYRSALENGYIQNIQELKDKFYQSAYSGRLLSQDGELSTFIVKHETAGKPESRKNVVGLILEQASRNKLTENARIAGDGFLKFTLDNKTRSELRLIMPIAAAGVALFLFSLFGRLWKTILVLFTAATAVLVALSIMVGLGHKLTIIALALPVMLSVIVVADSLHIIRFWDNEIDTASPQTTKEEILTNTFKATWLPCFTTSATSAVGFGVFYFSELIPLREFGIDSFIGIIMGYVIMMLAVFFGLFSMTPNAMSRRGGRYHELSIPDRAADSFLRLDWSIVGNNRPLTFAVAGFLVVASIFALAMNAKSESNLLDVFFKKNSLIYSAFTLVDNELGGSGVVSMVFRTSEEDFFRTFEPFEQVLNFEGAIRSLREINSTESYTDPIGQIHRNLVSDGSDYPQSEEQLAQEMLLSEWSRSADGRDVLAENVNFSYDSKHLRAYTGNLSSVELDKVIKKLEGQLSAQTGGGLPLPIFTGHSVFFAKLSNYILETQFATIALTFIFIFLILTLEFNFRLAMAGMLACSLPVLITMGTIALLGFPFDFATVIIASVTMGLSIDDTIHILHSYQHYLVDEHKSQRQSLRQALFIPGRPIVQSTFLFCFGAGVFLVSDLVMLQRFASFTIMGLVLALLGAVLLLPSLLSLNFFNQSSIERANASL